MEELVLWLFCLHGRMRTAQNTWSGRETYDVGGELPQKRLGKLQRQTSEEFQHDCLITKLLMVVFENIPLGEKKTL